MQVGPVTGATGIADRTALEVSWGRVIPPHTGISHRLFTSGVLGRRQILFLCRIRRGTRPAPGRSRVRRGFHPVRDRSKPAAAAPVLRRWRRLYLQQGCPRQAAAAEHTGPYVGRSSAPYPGALYYQILALLFTSVVTYYSYARNTIKLSPAPGDAPVGRAGSSRHIRCQRLLPSRSYSD